MKQLEPGTTTLTSFVKTAERPTTGCWSAGFWQRIRERPADQCACGATTTRFVCTMLLGVGRSRFDLEEVAECAACARHRAITILRARQENQELLPWIREREAAYLREWEAELETAQAA